MDTLELLSVACLHKESELWPSPAVSKEEGLLASLPKSQLSVVLPSLPVFSKACGPSKPQTPLVPQPDSGKVCRVSSITEPQTPAKRRHATPTQHPQLWKTWVAPAPPGSLVLRHGFGQKVPLKFRLKNVRPRNPTRQVPSLVGSRLQPSAAAQTRRL